MKTGCTGIIIAILVLLGGIFLGFITASFNTSPIMKGEIQPDASSQIYDINGNLITTVHAVENRIPVSLNKLPANLKNAFIATEDARFYSHIGIDPRGILRAIWANIRGQGISEGASTITQQLARNTLLTQDQTFKRKIQEVFIALQIERQYSKDEILEMYLNEIYFGNGAYGVEAASELYFGKPAEKLTLNECAILAGIPKSPNYYNPINNIKATKERQTVVLDQMVKYGYLDNMTASKVKNEPIPAVPKNSDASPLKFASYFVDYVTQLLVEKYGEDSVYRNGLRVYTTLDPDMQKAAEQVMALLPVYNKDKNGIRQPEGAIVAVDPHNGYIKAMVGGRGDDQFNRAVLAERQPGSAFKPFVYLAALDNGMTPNTIINDHSVSFGDYSPMNYDRRFHGNVSLRTALTYSYNVPVIMMANTIGTDKIINYAKSLGITSLVTNGPVNDNNLAMALGGLSKGVSPLQMASAYGVLANMGVMVPTTPIIKVVDRNGKVLEQIVVKEQTVVNPKTVYTLVDMMKNVIQRGTGAGANIDRPAAGKTGTTSDYRDAWFVGFTPDLSCAVWMGCDSGEELEGVTGADLPATLWQKFMSQAVNKLPNRDFPKPDGASIPAETNIESSKDDNKEDNKTNEKTNDPNKPTQPNTPKQPSTPSTPSTGVLPNTPSTPSKPNAPSTNNKPSN